MIHAAAELFGQRGYYATTFSDVVRESGAPRGSTYFHFPGGKAELAREAIARAGDELEEMVAQAARHADDPGSLVHALAQIMAGRLERSGYQSGCAIATMVLELAPRDEEFSAGFDSVFARWRAALVTRFEPLGIAPRRWDLSHVKAMLVGGSAVPRAMIAAFEQRHGIPIVQGWGMTETSPVASTATLPPSRPLPEAGPGE